MTGKKHTAKNAKSASPKPGDHGRALVKYLRDAVAGTALTTWARQNGITPTNIRRWEDGVSDPELTTLVQIANALGRRPVDLLIEARYVDPTDLGITVEYPARTPSIDEAIEGDPTLNEAERVALRLARQMGLSARRGKTPNEITLRTVIEPPPD